MAQHKPGLHKDVKTIFEGVWDPEIDNIQQLDGLNSPAVGITSRPIHEPVVHSEFKTHSNVSVKQWKRLLLMPSRKKRKRNKFLSILRY